MAKKYQEVIIHFRVIANENAAELLNQGAWGTFEMKKGEAFINVIDAPGAAHELGHFIEHLYDLPANLNTPND